MALFDYMKKTCVVFNKMKKETIRFYMMLFIFCTVSVPFFASNAQNVEIESIMKKVRVWSIQTYYEQLPDSILSQAIDSINSDGSYSDIDYTSTLRTPWIPQQHYRRILRLCLAYINPSCKWYADEMIYKKIVKGIEYWFEVNPKASNWFHIQIDEPLYWGLILVAMKGEGLDLPQDLENKIVDKWKNNGSNPEEMGGSNRSTMALSWMYFGCVTNDMEIVRKSVEYIFEPVSFAEMEGFQVDYSFFQHGHQLYIGGYGVDILDCLLQTAVCVKGTEFEMSEEKVAFLRNYILNTYSIVFRGNTMNWSCSGRYISRFDFLDKVNTTSFIDKMIELDHLYESEYIKIKRRLLGASSPSSGIDPYHAHFFRGDYTVHVRPSYSFSTRIVSSRTARQEYANGENNLCYFLSDGATEIKLSGNEYRNIMPFWDWNMIPGVTAPIMNKIPKAPQYITYGTSEFVGGVSDSIYGCSAYQYYDEFNDINTGAFKGYFFFDDEVVCLGANIFSNHDDVQTTINQCWGKESYSVGNGFDTENYNGNTSLKVYDKNINWVLHDGIGYYFPEKQQVSVSNMSKTGNWRWISTAQEDKELTGKVFSISLNHPPYVKEGKYSYIVIPNSTESSLYSYQKDNQVEILANTDSVQVVRHNGLHVIECIFYKACQFSHSTFMINASHPCALIIKDFDESVMIHVADPSQSKSLISIGVKLDDMADMVYGNFDYSNVGDWYAGMTKALRIMKIPTFINNLNTVSEGLLSTNPVVFKFNRRLKGYYSLLKLDGTVVTKVSFDADEITLTARKGGYLLDIRPEGDKHIIKKFFVK